MNRIECPVNLRQYLGERIKKMPSGCWIVLTREGEPIQASSPAIKIDGVVYIIRPTILEQDIKQPPKPKEVAIRVHPCTEKRCVNPDHFTFGLPIGNTTENRGHRPKGVKETKPRKPFRWSAERRAKFREKQGRI